MIGDQFDLFEERAASARQSCVVISFPLARRRKKILTVARTLDARKTDQGKLAAWTRAIDELASELRRHGAADRDVERELWSFRAAVEAELATDRNLRPSGGRA
jgi:hypothetical protein